MLYQSNLFQDTIGLWHYPAMDEKIFQSQVSFKLKYILKLNWIFIITSDDSNNSIFAIQLNADKKIGIRKLGSISQ